MRVDTGKDISDPKEGCTVTVKFNDGRRGVYVADAHIDDPVVKRVLTVGEQQARRSRPVIRTPRVTIPAKGRES